MWIEQSTAIVSGRIILNLNRYHHISRSEISAPTKILLCVLIMCNEIIWDCALENV